MQEICSNPKKARAEHDLRSVEPRVLLQLLITHAGLAVTLSRIDHTATRDALGLGRLGEDPCESNCGRDRKKAIEIAKHGFNSSLGGAKDRCCVSA